MKVLYIDEPLDPPGGGQLSLLNLVKSLSRGAFEPTVFLSSGGVFSLQLRDCGIRAEVVPLAGIFSRVRDHRPDVVHCNSSTGRYTFAAALAAKSLGVPLVWHNRVIDSAGWKERLTALLADRILVISDAVGRKFAWCGSKVERVYNAVDTGIFFPAPDAGPSRRELGAGPGTSVIGVFSRLEPWKGQDLFLRAAALLAAERPEQDFIFLLAGEGPDKARLTALAGELGLGRRVVFSGYRADVPALMNACDIVVNPSVSPEPFGRTIIEAMSCGKPVAATVGGGPDEIIKHGVDGLLVKPSPTDLAEALASLLPGGSRQASELGKNARRKVLERFGLGAQAARMEEIYRGLLHGR